MLVRQAALALLLTSCVSGFTFPSTGVSQFRSRQAAAISLRPHRSSALKMQAAPPKEETKPQKLVGKEGARLLLSKMSKEDVDEMFHKQNEIDEKEFKAGLMAQGVVMTEYEYMSFLKEIDVNADGKVCVADFTTAVGTIKKTGAKRALSTNTVTAPIKETKDSLLGNLAAETDQWRENSRRYRRTVFAYDDWVKYRSSTRLWENLITTLDSAVIRSLWFDISVVVAVCSGALLYNHGVGDAGYLKTFFEGLAATAATEENKASMESLAAWAKSLPMATLPLAPFNLASSSLGLLLVFRTNGAFQRFFEARALWGALINTCRTLTRQGLMYCEDPKDAEEIGRRSIVFARTLKRHLRFVPGEEEATMEEITNLVGRKEARRIMSATHRPMQAMIDIAAIVRHAPMTYSTAHQRFDWTLQEFSNQFGACERIFKTPLPLIYTRHTARFLTIWLLLLPFALYKDTGGDFVLIPICAVISAFMLGIEELGVSIAEPFSILALESMCDGIEGSCTEAVKRALGAEGANEGLMPPEKAGPDAKKMY